MNQRNLLLSAVFVAAALAAVSAEAQDRNGNGGILDSGDRGVITPSSGPQSPSYSNGIPSGTAAIPSTANPMNPNESKPFVQEPEGVHPLVRGDNLNLPKPVTPSAANESAPSPMHRDPTNMTGMEGGAVGGTR